MQGLPRQKLEFPFARGLNQKVDARIVQAPELVILKNGEFDETGGIRLRKPYVSLATALLAGGAISALRRVYAYGDELVAFTQTELLSFSPERAGWVSRGTHLAVKVEEKPVFSANADQIDCDRAELGGTVVYTWTDKGVGQVYAAAVDKTSGATIAGPTAIVGGTSRPRLVTLATKILLFNVTAGPNLVVRAIDPANPSAGFASAATNVVTLAAGFNSYYDVTRVLGADTAVFACRLNPTTSYTVGAVTAALVVSTSTKARACTGAIAISSAPDGTFQIVRGNGTNVQGDRLTAALADAVAGQAIGTVFAGAPGVAWIAAAHRSVQDGGAYRCYVFWTDDAASEAADPPGWGSRYNYVDTAGAIGAEASFVKRTVVGSRAFDYNGRVFVALLFLGESNSPAGRASLQNTAFLYRDDATLHAKIGTARMGGFTGSVSWLPGVALTAGATTFSWCAIERRRIPVNYSYAGHAPRDITITFDSNEARRVAQLGRTLYIAGGGQVLQYDGRQIVEVGFPIAPWYMAATELAAGGIVTNGTYAVKGSLRWDNAKGERDRSTAAMTAIVTIAFQPAGIELTNAPPLHITLKTANPPTMEWWRTKVNPLADSPFYLVSSQDPAVVANPNRYVANDHTADSLAVFQDTLSDVAIGTNELHPENDGVLENIAPPAATLIAASQDRLFIAGIPGEPDIVRYSKQRGEDQVAAFNEALKVIIPNVGGDITGLAFLNETLVVFRETAIYALEGFGLTNAEGGSNFEVRLVSADVGAVAQEAIALTPMGLAFKSRKGWQLLTHAWGMQYIGGPICDYDGDTVHAVHVVEAQHQLRVVTSARVLVYDYLAEAWGEWTVSDGLHACIWRGTYHYLAAASVKAEQASYATANYELDVEMLIHLAGLQGFARLYRILVLGEYRSAFTARVRLGGYTENSYTDDKTWAPSPTVVGGVLQFQHGPKYPQQQVARVRITSSADAGEKLKLTALTLEVGVKPGAFPHLPAAQRQ